ncbi:MAG: universal stress protein [Pseudomonadota bacterium]
MFKNILIPIEPKHFAESEKAMKVAGDLAKHYGGAITLMTLTPFIRTITRHVPQDAVIADFKAFVEKQSQALGLDLKAAFRVGDAVSERIVETAKETRADLIVMSSHDPVLSDYLFGSNASSVVLHTEASVLVVR